MNNKTVSGAMKKLLAVTCAFTLILGAAPVLGSTVLDAPALVVSANDEDPAPDLSDKNYISGCSVTLGGEIGLNIEVTVNDDDFDRVYIAMDNPDSNYKPLTIPKSELDKYKIGEGEQGTTYRFTYYIAPMDIGRKICFELQKIGENKALYTSDGSNIGNTFEYSVADYIDYFNNHKEIYDSETIALVNALKVYGETANYYFSNGDSIQPSFEVTNVTSDKVANNKLQFEGEEPADFSFEGSALYIDSKTSYRLYFGSNPGEVKLDGKVLEVHEVEKESGTYYYVEVPNISAQELDKTFKLTFSNGYKASFSALSYVYSVLKMKESGLEYEGFEPEKLDRLAKLAKALYAYNFAANMYADKKYSGSTLSNFELTPTENENVYTFSYPGITDPFTATYSDNNWKIVDSFKITNTKDMLVICEALSKIHPIVGCLTPFRAAADMVDEWLIHNAVYNLANSRFAILLLKAKFPEKTDEEINAILDQAKASTKDVDLNTADQGKTENEFMKQYGVG